MGVRLAMAVDVGGTKLRAALVTSDGRVLHRDVRATPATSGAQAVVSAIAEACRAVRLATDAPRDLPLGLCAPGPLNARTGIALGTPTIAGFTDFPLRQAVEDALQTEVIIENDGPAGALGEWRYGGGRGTDSFAYITVSTGIGGGLVADGRLVRGRLGLAGHVGHLPVKPGGAVCFCGQQGHWEAEASGTALGIKARAAGFRSLPDVFELARAGNGAAMEFTRRAADDIAVGLVAITHLTSPEVLVIGGGVSNAFDLLGPLLRERLDRSLLPSFRQVRLKKAECGDDCGLLGVGLLALDPTLRA